MWSPAITATRVRLTARNRFDVPRAIAEFAELDDDTAVHPPLPQPVGVTRTTVVYQIAQARNVLELVNLAVSIDALIGQLDHSDESANNADDTARREAARHWSADQSAHLDTQRANIYEPSPTAAFAVPAAYARFAFDDGAPHTGALVYTTIVPRRPYRFRLVDARYVLARITYASAYADLLPEHRALAANARAWARAQHRKLDRFVNLLLPRVQPLPLRTLADDACGCPIAPDSLGCAQETADCLLNEAMRDARPTQELTPENKASLMKVAESSRPTRQRTKRGANV